MNKKLLIGLTLIALVGGIAYAYTQNRTSNETDDTTTQEELDQMNAEDTTLINDKEVSEETVEEPTTSKPAESKKSAAVVISQADAEDENLVQVRAYANVFEDGTCTATFSKGGVTKKYTVNTEQQAQYTQCDPFQIPKSDFSSGTWKLTVTFESKTYNGQASQDIAI